MSTKVIITLILPSGSKLCSESRIRNHLLGAASAPHNKTPSPLDTQLHEALRVGCIKIETCQDEEERE